MKNNNVRFNCAIESQHGAIEEQFFGLNPNKTLLKVAIYSYSKVPDGYSYCDMPTKVVVIADKEMLMDLKQRKERMLCYVSGSMFIKTSSCASENGRGTVLAEKLNFISIDRLVSSESFIEI